MVKQKFVKMEVREGMYTSLVYSIEASRKGAYIFHYNVPVLIVAANQKEYGNNIADCACTLENMMLMANEEDGLPLRAPLPRNGNPVIWVG